MSRAMERIGDGNTSGTLACILLAFVVFMVIIWWRGKS